jgi:hypothetical protein
MGNVITGASLPLVRAAVFFNILSFYSCQESARVGTSQTRSAPTS